MEEARQIHGTRFPLYRCSVSDDFLRSAGPLAAGRRGRALPGAAALGSLLLGGCPVCRLDVSSQLCQGLVILQQGAQ